MSVVVSARKFDYANPVVVMHAKLKPGNLIQFQRLKLHKYNNTGFITTI